LRRQCLLKTRPSFHAYSLFKNDAGCRLVQGFPSFAPARIAVLLLDRPFKSQAEQGIITHISEKSISLIPTFRIPSRTGTPASACFNAASSFSAPYCFILRCKTFPRILPKTSIPPGTKIPGPINQRARKSG
jgi:hypothetical protein